MRTYTDFVYHTGSEAYQRRSNVWLFWRHQLKITDQATYVWDELSAQQVWVILSALYVYDSIIHYSILIQWVFVTALSSLGEPLEAIMGSQRWQTQLGVKVPTEMTDLAKSYRDRWNQLRVMVALHHSKIQESITEFDTNNFMDTSKLYSHKRYN